MRTAAVVASAGALLAGSTIAPRGLRAIDAFRVQRVEVVGARYLSADAAVVASGITSASNVFDDPAPWIDALLAHPLVLRAEVSRRLPATLVLRVTESMPVAFARTPEVRAIDARGRVLPADPAADGMDLPVLALESRVSADGLAADEETLALAAFIGRVAREEPGLLGWISEAGMSAGAVRLVLRTATDAEVLLPADAPAPRLREVHLTIAELATPRLAASAGVGAAGHTAVVAEPDLARVRRIDGRYLDQIVVALHRGKN